MRTCIRGFGLVAMIAATVSCGDASRQGSGATYLVIDTLAGRRGATTLGTPSNPLISDVITNVTTPDPCTTTTPCPTVFGDSGTVTLRAPLKDIGATTALTPTTNNEITITRLHVTYTRADGRNTPGVDVPFGFDSAITGTIQAGGTLTLGFELVRNVAKQEAPLVALRNSNNFISAIASITFYGTDRVGNNAQVTGQMQIEFGNFGDQ
jgi:hypothetical protein